MQYKQFLTDISSFIPEKRIYTDELRRLAWGTDAGFYRLIPQIVIRSMNEGEVSKLLITADKYNLPVTFRAAGTSLSGQAISDSIIIVAGKHWEKYKVAADHSQITMQTGIIGDRVNQILKPYGVKFSPDPASVKYAMVGGIVMNNASGMNCGNHANSDKMLISARMIFPDGTVLDTGNEESKKQFLEKKPEFIDAILAIKNQIYENKELYEKIKFKYSIKNVMGLNILPFIEYDDPFDIITHLLVGSEGTLAFLSEVTMKTEHDFPFKASAMLYFKSIVDATKAVVLFDKLNKQHGFQLVKGAELLDTKSLSSVNDTTGEGLTAILTEVKGNSKEEIFQHIQIIEEALKSFDLATPVYFTDKEEEYSKYWKIRSGIFPSVGGTRPLGTTSLIEDVAFHIEDLPNAVADLQNLLVRHGYDDACIYGHSLQGNFHFILNQSFEAKEEVERYEKMMSEVVHLVVDKYNGSLKAEHGTGRNMAPFVAYEWGNDAFEIMKKIKQLFDPKNLLNPGVIFNNDPKCHIKNLKPLPLIELKNGKKGHTADKCIECGFCEINCLSSGFTLSARQRIVAQREITRLRKNGETPDRLASLEKDYVYLGEQTCAVDGLCATSCPMGINTGDLTHDIRNANVEMSKLPHQVGDFAAKHFSGIKNTLRPLLGVANAAHSIIGSNLTNDIGKGLSKIGLPLWSSALPKPYKLKAKDISYFKADKKVVYFPSCINQTMGVSKNAPDQEPLIQKMQKLLNKAGYEVIFPKGMDNLCCGTIWESKGMYDIAERKTHDLEKALWEATEQGKHPVLCDQSPCLHRMRATIKKLKLYEPAEFIHDFLMERLQFTPIDEPITVHVTCSMTRLGLGNKIIALAERCSTNVLVPAEVGCCGFAGDRGFTYPELNEYALRKLKPQIVESDIKIGYSNSRTCEIGLETNSGIPYESIVYLVDKVTKPFEN
jgi:D-lactate dehydrogenase